MAYSKCKHNEQGKDLARDGVSHVLPHEFTKQYTAEHLTTELMSRHGPVFRKQHHRASVLRMHTHKELRPGTWQCLKSLQHFPDILCSRSLTAAEWRRKGEEKHPPLVTAGLLSHHHAIDAVQFGLEQRRCWRRADWRVPDRGLGTRVTQPRLYHVVQVQVLRLGK